MATNNNAVNVTLKQQTGTGKFVGDTSPTLVTPTLGVASATSINFGDNALANYKEGTWTPVLTFGGGSTGIAYTTQTGVYRRIGNILVFSFSIVLSNKGSSTGVVSISGLPNAGAASTNQSFMVNLNNITYTQLPFLNNVSATTLQMYQPVSGSGATQLQDTNFANNSSLFCTGALLI